MAGQVQQCIVSAQAVAIAHRAITIAKQSVIGGLGPVLVVNGFRLCTLPQELIDRPSFSMPCAP
jgi:hypothetical protein